MSFIIHLFSSASKEFGRVEFSHVRWQGNKPARLLAKYALGIDDFSIWLEKDPYFLSQTLIQDVDCFSSF